MLIALPWLLKMSRVGFGKLLLQNRTAFFAVPLVVMSVDVALPRRQVARQRGLNTRNLDTFRASR